MKYTAPIEDETINDILIFGNQSIQERNTTYQVDKYHPGYVAIGQDGGGVLYLTDDRLGVYAIGCGDPSEPRPVHSDLSAWQASGCPCENEPEDAEPIIQDLWVVPGASIQQLSRVRAILGLSVGLSDLKQLIANAPGLLASQIAKPRTLIKLKKEAIELAGLEFRETPE